MDGMRTWIIALIALIAGAVISYVYVQGQDVQNRESTLNSQITELETKLAAETKKVQDAQSEINGLKMDLDNKTREVDEQQAKILDLEAKLQQTTPPPAQ